MGKVLTFSVRVIICFVLILYLQEVKAGDSEWRNQFFDYTPSPNILRISGEVLFAPVIGISVACFTFMPGFGLVKFIESMGDNGDDDYNDNYNDNYNNNYNDDDDNDKASIIGGSITGYMGYVLGCAAGVTLIGNIGSQKGSFNAAIEGGSWGGLIGLPFLILFIDSQLSSTEDDNTGNGNEEENGDGQIISYIGVAVAIISPIIGSVIGFNSSRKYDIAFHHHNSDKYQVSILKPSLSFKLDPIRKSVTEEAKIDLVMVNF